MKHTLLTLMASAILCATTLGIAEPLQEMEVIDHGITTAVVRDPNVAILIVGSVIPELSFESNIGIHKVKHDKPGEWILYLFPGTNLITFKAEGYQTLSNVRLVVPKKKARKVEVKPLKKYGVLTVESDPPGGQIFLDGKDTEKQTPYSFENLAAGLHLVVLKMDDYQTDTTRVDVKHEDMLRINRTLQAVGYLTLDTTPSGAEVVIDSGTEYAITVKIPVEKLGLKTGPHILSVHKVGYALIEKELVLIEKGKTIRKDLGLQEIFGSITIHSKPDGAGVYIDGKKVGETPYGPVEIQAKDHHVRVVPTSLYDPWEQVVVVEEGKEKEVSARCEPRFAAINVFSEPQQANVFLDDRLIGTTPIQEEKVEPGTYRLRIEDPEGKYEVYTTRFTVDARGQKTLSRKLVHKTGTLIVHSDPKDAEIYVDGNRKGTAVQLKKGLTLPTGEHKVVLRKKGYFPYVKLVHVQSHQDTRIRKTLEAVSVAEIRREIARKRDKLRSLKSSQGKGWWGMGIDDYSGKLQRTKEEHNVGCINGILLNGLGGLFPLIGMFQKDTTPSYRATFAIQTLLAVYMWSAINKWFANTEQKPTSDDEESSPLDRIPKEGKEDEARAAKNMVWKSLAASIAVGLIGDLIAHTHDDFMDPDQLRREIQELEEELQGYSLHYDPVKDAVMVQYTIRW